MNTELDVSLRLKLKPEISLMRELNEQSGSSVCLSFTFAARYTHDSLKAKLSTLHRLSFSFHFTTFLSFRDTPTDEHVWEHRKKKS